MTWPARTRPPRRRARTSAVLAAVVSGAALVAPLLTAGAARGAPSAPADLVTAAVVARDSSRTPSSGPPVQAQVGGAYTSTVPEGTSVSASGGAVTVAGLPPGHSELLALPAVSVADVQVRHDLELSLVDSRTALYETTQVRRQRSGDHYGATVVVRADGALALRADRVRAGMTTVLGRTDLPVRARSGERLHVEARVVGSAPVTVLARAWEHGQSTPGWQLTATDTSSLAIPSPGAVGLGAHASASAPSRAFSVADLAAWSLAPARTTTSATAGTASAATTAGTAAPLLSTTSTAGFSHPGIVVGASQLSFVKGRIAAGAQPWTSALAAAKGSRYASPSWTPHPVATVACGPHNDPDVGCTAETDDAQAAYTDALLWSLTGDSRYAATSIRILDAWSGVLRQHRFDTTTYINGKVQAAWAAETFTRAAEVLRYTGSGWSADRVTRFEKMLTTAFLPTVRDGWTGGGANWQLSMAEATMSIGVFTNDRSVFDDGVGDWRSQVRGAIYLSSDGARPSPPAGTTVKATGIDAYWYHPTRFVDGLEQETCRDSGHAAMGLGAALSAAETGRLQGVDLYGEQRTRLVAAMEYATRYLNDPGAPGWACASRTTVTAMSQLAWEAGYAEYGVRRGLSLPQTRTFVLAHRPARTALHLNWGTLTSARS